MTPAHDSGLSGRLLSLSLLTLVVLAPLAPAFGPGLVGTASASDGIHYVTDSGFEIEDASGGAVPRSGNPFTDDDTLDLPGINLSASGNAYVTLEQRNGTFTNLTNVDDDPSITVTPEDKQEVALQGGFDSLNFSDANYTADNESVDFVYSAGSTASLRLESTGQSSGDTLEARDGSGTVIDTATVQANGSVTFSGLPSGDKQVNVKPPVATVSNFGVTNPSGREVTVSFDSDRQLSTIEASVSGAESTTLSTSAFSETDNGGSYTYEATYTGSSGGTYTVTLDTAEGASGLDGASGESEDVLVDVTPPTADAGGDRTLGIGETDSFHAGASQDNVGIASYEWDFGDGETATDEQRYHSYDEPGNYSVTLTVTDTVGQTDTDTVTVQVEDRTPPTAAVSGNQSVAVGESLSVTGNTSTDNVAITGYEWDFGDESNATGETATHVYDSPGEYTVSLTVTDGDGNTDTDTMAVTVSDETAPTADAGPNRTVDEGIEVSLDGSTSSDNVGIVSYEWDFGDGSTGTGATPAHTFAEPGSYTVTLTVSDAAGNTNTDTVSIEVRDATPPTVDASVDPTTGDDTTVTLQADATDNVGVTSYEWTFGDGTTATGESVEHTYGTAGTYDATVTVSDAPSNTATDTVTVTVGNGSLLVADAGPAQRADVGETVTLDGTESQRSAEIERYEWRLGTESLGEGAEIDHAFSQDGRYNVTLVVSDGADRTATATTTVVVGDVTPPTAALSAPSESEANDSVALSATGSTDNEGITSYTWSLGNGQRVTTESPTLTTTYREVGTQEVSVTVSDAAGNTDTATTTVEITEDSGTDEDASENTGLAISVVDDDPSQPAEETVEAVSARAVSVSNAPAQSRLSVGLTAPPTSDEAVPIEDQGPIVMDGLDLSASNGGDMSLTVETRAVRLADSAELSAPQITSLSRSGQEFARATGSQPTGYVIVTHSIPESEVSNVTLRFSIRKSHLDARGANPGEVTLYRNESTGQRALPTTLTGESDGYYEFEAASPGLSEFTVGTQTPLYDVTSLTAPGEATVGESVSIDATVENIGSADGEYLTRLLSDGGELTSESITVGAGQTDTVTLTHTFEQSGTYEMQVGSQTATVVVEEPADDQASEETPGEQDSTETADDSGVGVLPLIGALVVVVVLVALVVAWRRGIGFEG